MNAALSQGLLFPLVILLVEYFVIQPWLRYRESKSLVSRDIDNQTGGRKWGDGIRNGIKQFKQHTSYYNWRGISIKQHFVELVGFNISKGQAEIFLIVNVRYLLDKKRPVGGYRILIDRIGDISQFETLETRKNPFDNQEIPFPGSWLAVGFLLLIVFTCRFFASLPSGFVIDITGGTPAPVSEWSNLAIPVLLDTSINGTVGNNEKDIYSFNTSVAGKVNITVLLVPVPEGVSYVLAVFHVRTVSDVLAVFLSQILCQFTRAASQLRYITMDSQLTELLKSKKFKEARLLLQRNLEMGELLDPRSDQLWAPIADTTAASIGKENGLDGTILFWEELLAFFMNCIEPKWGHAHKGHIYFRLALHVGKRDFALARHYLTLAREEDLIQQRNLGGTEQDIIARAQQSSSHVALVLLERIKETDFDSNEEQAQFFDNLFGPSFDAAINGYVVKPELVLKALERITPEQVRAICLSLYRELFTAANQNLPFATVSLTGTVLESILLGILIYQKGINTLPSGKPIKEVELGPLVNQAIDQNIFPSRTVKSTMRLVHIFRNRLHPGNEMQQEHKLTNRVSITLKIMFDLALVEWSQSIVGREIVA